MNLLTYVHSDGRVWAHSNGTILDALKHHLLDETGVWGEAQKWSNFTGNLNDALKIHAVLLGRGDPLCMRMLGVTE